MCMMLDVPPAIEAQVADYEVAVGKSVQQVLLDFMQREFARVREGRGRNKPDMMDDRLYQRGQLAKRYFAEMRNEASADMTLDEINAEIAASRAERRHIREKTLA